MRATRVEDVPMIWLLLSVGGLAVEIAVIIALARLATSRYEAEVPSDPGRTSATPGVVRTAPAARGRAG
jgi:hypothetical protein